MSEYSVKLAKIEAQIRKKISLNTALAIIGIFTLMLAAAGYLVGERYFWVNNDTYYEYKLDRLRDNLRENPQSANVRVEMAMTDYLMGESEKAVKSLRDILRKDPANRPASLYLGLILSDLKEYRESTQLLSQYIKQSQGIETRLAYLYLGLNYKAAGDNKNALVHLEKAGERDPSNPLVYLAIGQIYERTNDTEKAIKAYERALEISPGNREAQEALTALGKK